MSGADHAGDGGVGEVDVGGGCNELTSGKMGNMYTACGWHWSGKGAAWLHIAGGESGHGNNMDGTDGANGSTCLTEAGSGGVDDGSWRMGGNVNGGSRAGWVEERGVSISKMGVGTMCGKSTTGAACCEGSTCLTAAVSGSVDEGSSCAGRNMNNGSGAGWLNMRGLGIVKAWNSLVEVDTND